LAVLSLRTKRKLPGWLERPFRRLCRDEARLRDLGWSVGRNLRLDYCFLADASRLRAQTERLVRLAADLILAVATPAVAGLLPVSH
jgi:hypothetical protein